MIPILNIIYALSPLFRRPDDLSDIPLTPSQRKLLGLPPSSAPPTPGSVYSTPPRYVRTPSIGGSPASIGSIGGGGLGNSPLGGRGGGGSPATITGSGGTGNGSGSGARLGGSPLSGSPLLQKSLGGALGGLGLTGNGQRRSSLGSPSPLGGGASAAKGGLFGDVGSGTPSPTNGKRSSVGLNSKWLYDRGRRNSGGVKLY
jgi:nucleoporin POM34